MCAGLTAFNSLRRAGITPTSRVAVIGAGGVGALAVRFAIAMGARVTVIDRPARAEAAARELGAERFITTEDADPAAALRAWDGGANLIVNAAPSTATAAATLTGLAPDGTLVLCGYGPEPLTLPTEPMVLNRLHVMANPSGSPHDARDALAFAAAHGILPEYTPIGLLDANTALEAMARGQAGKRSVITFD
jgi:propanol-preferring alcohol dehydrogenase